MKKCSECRNYYPDSFEHCPVDNADLQSESNGKAAKAAYPAEPAQIKVRTLLISIVILFLTGIICFVSVFSYFYLKPKYGVLVVKTTPPGAAIPVTDH